MSKTDTPTAVVPLAVVPRELIERCLGLIQHMLSCNPPADGRAFLSPLAADLEAALAAAGGRKGRDHA